jgi:hypothetical protein
MRSEHSAVGVPSPTLRDLRWLATGIFISWSSFAYAEAPEASAASDAPASEAAPSANEPFDFMHLLAAHGLHYIQDESWNAYGQFTWISNYKPPFSARYTNLNGSINSLPPNGDVSYTGTLTAFLGLRLWKGAEVYYVPELIEERPLSGALIGLGAIQNFELQKSGLKIPQIYRSRSYIRQTFGFGGERIEKPSGPMQLSTTEDSRRLVLTVGSFSILDFFDKNSVTGDPRRGFMNIVFMTYNAYDFASDARGYSWGGVAELYYDAWAFRFGRITPPKNPNALAQEFRLYKYYGDQAEVEHQHQLAGQAGAVRVLAYRNREVMGRFDDAVAAFETDPTKNATTCTGFNYGSNNANAPDLCWARRPNIKVGIGLSLEQHLTDDIGVFFRGMYSDGQTEVDAFFSTDRSIAFGGLANGSRWRRPADTVGVGAGLGWISQAHANYLRLGGVDGFIGDGTINQAMESAIEAYYSLNVVSSLWLTADYQHITNPAFNADRGPINLFSGRVHAEF